MLNKTDIFLLSLAFLNVFSNLNAAETNIPNPPSSFTAQDHPWDHGEKIDLNWKKILEYNSKYYFNDLWIRNSINYNFNFDIWKLLENYIFNILIKNWYKVFVWNKKWLEIDFVAEKDWKRKYFQVAYLISDEKVYEREFWNLKKINDNWDKYVLSMDDIKFNDENGIKHLNILNFEEINLS